MKADDGEFSVELLMLNQSNGYIERGFSIVDKVRNVFITLFIPRC